VHDRVPSATRGLKTPGYDRECSHDTERGGIIGP
jgi:hypothetical protein